VFDGLMSLLRSAVSIGWPSMKFGYVVVAITTPL
jgi:hypothetical protein